MHGRVGGENVVGATFPAEKWGRRSGPVGRGGTTLWGGTTIATPAPGGGVGR